MTAARADSLARGALPAPSPLPTLGGAQEGLAGCTRFQPCETGHKHQQAAPNPGGSLMMACWRVLMRMFEATCLENTTSGPATFGPHRVQADIPREANTICAMPYSEKATAAGKDSRGDGSLF